MPDLSLFLRQYGTHDNPGISFPLHALYLEYTEYAH